MLEWRQRFARHARRCCASASAISTTSHIRVLSLLLDLPDHDPVDAAEGRERDSRHARPDAEPHGAARSRRDRRASRPTPERARRTSRFSRARSDCRRSSDCATRRQQLHGRRDASILDGSTGTARDQSDDAGDRVVSRARARRRRSPKRSCGSSPTLEAVTTDGVRITLRANVDLPEEAELAATQRRRRRWPHAHGVPRRRPRDDARRGRAVSRVRRVVEAFGGQPVVIRTFDIGGDKLPVGGFPTEPNPFLGWRAIRMCLDQPELFGMQLRALLRAAVHGDVRIMLPLVVTLDEVRAARELLDEAARELEARGVEFRRDVPLGVMIETPAAAVACDTFVERRRVLQHRHERSRAVHAGRRSRQREPRVALHAAASGGAAADPAHGGDGARARPRRRRLRRDGVAAADGVRADRARRAAAERRAALGAAREAHRAQRHRARTRSSPRRRRCARSPRTRRARSWRVVSPTSSATRRSSMMGCPVHAESFSFA